MIWQTTKQTNKTFGAKRNIKKGGRENESDKYKKTWITRRNEQILATIATNINKKGTRKQINKNENNHAQVTNVNLKQHKTSDNNKDGGTTENARNIRKDNEKHKPKSSKRLTGMHGFPSNARR